MPQLCSALAEGGHAVTLLTASGPSAPSVEGLRDRVAVVGVREGPYWAAHASLDWVGKAFKAAGQADVMHSHGLWLFPNWAVPTAAAVRGLPLVVSPRGMLSPWARGQSRLRKALVWALADRWALRAAAALHATSPLEAEEMRAMGLCRPIAVIPNGVDLEHEFAETRLSSLASPPLEPGRRVLFLSRIHPKKGLDLLLEAWRHLGTASGESRLIIAGPAPEPAVVRLEQQIGALESHGVEYRGPVYGDDRIGLLLEADVLVLPSHSENYGIVIAESLACGRPVITTTGTPWSSLAREGCGWWVEARVDTVAAALREALSASRDRLREMGRAGRGHVEQEHSLHATALKMATVYEWVCGRSPRPACVKGT